MTTDPGNQTAFSPQAIAIALVLLTLAVFWPVFFHDFVQFDDDRYILENPIVLQGVTWRGLAWAMTTHYYANWHPVTWISHMLDVELFGLNPAGHHASSLILHITNVLLLFWLFTRMTGRLGASAFIAAVFAIHPLRAESVAWVAERKDVLAATFWLLTLAAYHAYVQSREFRRYILVVLFLTLGLMAKPMLVTLPCVLLLLDYWPLQRFHGVFQSESSQIRIFSRLLMDKLLLFVIVAVSCVITWNAQQAEAAIQTFEQFPLGIRIGNAMISYIAYIQKLVWPTGLIFYYPHPGADISRVLVLVCELLLISVTLLVIGARCSRPYLIVGWFWYLGTLVPVIGLVQVGAQAMADRYTYIPQIGLLIIIAWGLPDLLQWIQLRFTRVARYTEAASLGRVGHWLGAVVIPPLAVAAHIQVGYWKDSETLFTRGLQVNERNVLAHYNLGTYYAKSGRYADAERHLRRALEVDRHHLPARNNLGSILASQGRYEEAEIAYLGALEINPTDALTLKNMGHLLLIAGRWDDALRLLQISLDVNPHDVEILNNVAWLLATKADRSIEDQKRAIHHATRAVELTRGAVPGIWDTLSVAYAASGRFDEAMTASRTAIQLARMAELDDDARTYEKRLRLYESALPYRPESQ